MLYRVGVKWTFVSDGIVAPPRAALPRLPDRLVFGFQIPYKSDWSSGIAAVDAIFRIYIASSLNNLASGILAGLNHRTCLTYTLTTEYTEL